jgi:hypothetical protein
MNFIELIGFIISMVALFLLMFKQSKESKQRKEDPENYIEELQDEEVALQELLHSLNIREKPNRSVIESKMKPALLEDFQGSPESPKQKTSSPIQMTKLQPKKFINPYKQTNLTQPKFSSKANLFKRVSLKEAMIISSILGPPKSLKPDRKE